MHVDQMCQLWASFCFQMASGQSATGRASFGGGGGGKFVYHKWPNQIFPTVKRGAVGLRPHGPGHAEPVDGIVPPPIEGRWAGGKRPPKGGRGRMSPTLGERGVWGKGLFCQGPWVWPFFSKNILQFIFIEKGGQMTTLRTPLDVLIPKCHFFLGFGPHVGPIQTVYPP